MSPITPPGGETPLTYTCFDIITDALIEAGILSPGESANLDPDTGQWAFRKFNYLVDIWQAKRAYVWGSNFQVFTLPVNTQPVTIGPDPSANLYVPQAPVRIESANLILNAPNSTPVDLKINIRDRAWYAAQSTKYITTNIPTDLFYDSGTPNGSLYFWPVCNVGQQVRLEMWNTVQSFAQINDPIGGPGGPGTLRPAYRAAFMLTLAEMLLPSSALEANPVLVKSAQEARAAVFGNNAKSPTSATADYGMPKTGRRKADFNWMTGGRPGGPPE
jgi:hypothetical protein